MPWNPDTQSFDPPQREFPITLDYDVEDEGAGRGLVIGLVLGVALWTMGILAWRSAGVRVVLEGVLLVMAVVVAGWLVLAAAHSLVERWRAAHPENPVVDWLRRSGL